LKKMVLYGLLLALGLFLTTMVFIPSIDDFALDNPFWNGMSFFNEYFRAKAISIHDIQVLHGRSVVFIIGPSREFTRGEADILASYVRGGGTLVIADDFGPSNHLLEYMGLKVRINGSLLADPLFKYRSMYFPQIVVNTKNNTLIYYDYGSFLIVQGGICIGYSSSFSYIDVNMNGLKDQNEPYGPFCTIYMERQGNGVVYVISDSSIFINSMINVGDNLDFIKDVVGDNDVYIVTDKWVVSPYTILRDNLAYTITMLFTTSLRYPAAILASMLAYSIGKHLYKIYVRKKSFYALGKERAIERVIALHPDWDPEILRRLAEEVGSYE